MSSVKNADFSAAKGMEINVEITKFIHNVVCDLRKIYSRYMVGDRHHPVSDVARWHPCATGSINLIDKRMHPECQIKTNYPASCADPQGFHVVYKK